MKTINFYKIVIVTLLLINTGTLAYLFIGRNERSGMPPHGNPVDHLIIERLQLTTAQQQQFNMLKHEHHERMLEWQEQSSRLHGGLFTLLKNQEKDTIAIDSFMQLIAANDRKKEMATYEHFEQLRDILTPAQQPSFDGLVEEISQKIMNPGRPGRPE